MVFNTRYAEQFAFAAVLPYLSAPKQLIMRTLLLLAAMTATLLSPAQKTEEFYNANFKPSRTGNRYYVVTEKKDSLWERKAWYIPENSMAMQGTYEDEACKTAHGKMTWYHANRFPKSTGVYVNGKKEGTWLAWDEKGHLRDSATYAEDKLRGIRIKWHSNGMMADSAWFDALGRGVEFKWHDDGTPAAAGRWTADTVKTGRWQYFHRNGKVQAIEDYYEGKATTILCYDAEGQPLASCEQKSATFPGGEQGWRRYVERNLDASIPVYKRSPPGSYTVIVQFIINTDGSIEGVEALTRHGYGMEEEVVRLIKKGPKWVPAMEFGTKVKAYRKQPVTFVISQQR